MVKVFFEVIKPRKKTHKHYTMNLYVLKIIQKNVKIYVNNRGRKKTLQETEEYQKKERKHDRI